MSKRRSAPARTLAVIALIGGFALLFVVVSTALEGGDDGVGNEVRQERVERKKQQRKAPRTYTIESGDTLTSISHETGIPIGQIERLNPEIDPQILVEGEELRLK